MTLAVVARFPWGRLREVSDGVAGAGFAVEQAVFLATDSRFSFADRTPDDRGQKVYPVANDAGLVFAGDVLAAQRAIRSIRKYFERRDRKSKEEPAEHVGRLIEAAYANERRRVEGKARPRPLHSLHILVGVCDHRGQSAVVRYSDSSGFRPIYLTGVEAIGWPQDIVRFKAALLETEANEWGIGTVDPTPDRWVMHVVMAMRDAVDAPQNPGSVGGPIQALAITSRGMSMPSISWTEGDPMDASTWTDATISSESVRPFTAGRGSAAAGLPEPELVVEHVCD